MDMIIGEGISNSFERELEDVKTGPRGLENSGSLLSRENSLQENEFSGIDNGNSTTSRDGLVESIKYLNPVERMQGFLKKWMHL